MSAPAYSLQAVKELIPVADLEAISKISVTIRKDIASYDSKDSNDLLRAISKRLIQLSRAIRAG